MINFKIGIMGTGNIAGKVADTIAKLDAFEIYAVASRDMARAEEFGEKYGIEKKYGSYEDLVADPDVELIYIATPHSEHAEEAKMCIEAGKPCLVEKAFSYNFQTAEEVLNLSKEKGVFCGEAMWIRYLPAYKFIVDKIRTGIIGEPQYISCSLGYDLRMKERVTKPELAGGVLLDLGVYPINVFTMIFGAPPVNMIASSMMLNTGVDAQISIVANFPNGKMGSALCTMLYKSDNEARIYGNKGYVLIDNINCPESIKIYGGDNKLMADLKVNEKQISGYEFEFMAARNAIITGKIDTPEMPHAETLRIMKLCDSLRDAWKEKYPMEVNQD